MSAPLSVRFALFAVLLLLMIGTRFTHAGSAGVLPDATWAVFFISGFYLSRDWRWSLTALFVAAVGADYVAIRYCGISNYCLTLSYWSVVPAYSLLWLGGAWLRGHYRRAPRDLARLALSLLVSVTLCFGITHSAFYWMSGRIAQPTLAEWAAVFVQWYPLFLGVTALYVAVGTVVHLTLTHRLESARLRRGGDGAPSRARAVKHAFEAGIRAQRGIEL